MSVTVNVLEAKTRFSELLRLAQAGEEVVIARAGVPIVRLEPIPPKKRDLSKAYMPGLGPVDEMLFLEPMSEEELDEIENGHPDDPLRESMTW